MAHRDMSCESAIVGRFRGKADIARLAVGSTRSLVTQGRHPDFMPSDSKGAGD